MSKATHFWANHCQVGQVLLSDLTSPECETDIHTKL